MKERDFKDLDKDSFKKFLANDSESMTERIRSLWYVRMMENQEEAIEILAAGLKSDSVLLQHEVCYVMGQMGNKKAAKVLREVLKNESFDVMTRHEAAEAIGAIHDEDSLDLLKQYLKDEQREIRETCELAIQKILEPMEEPDENEENFRTSIHCIDPTRAYKNKSLEELKTIFLSLDESLYNKYRAMFSLRNIAFSGNVEAVEILCLGLNKDEGALFKHEIAFVLGQLQHKASSEALSRVLRDPTEEPMVRHEAAEALGSISEEKSLEILKQFQNDSIGAIKDSCKVGIDLFDYDALKLSNEDDD